MSGQSTAAKLAAARRRIAELERAAALVPAENLALTVARGQVERGDNPEFGVTTMLVLALDRLTGRDDWTKGGLVIDGHQVAEGHRGGTREDATP